MSNKAYDILKWVALVLLPGLGTLYFGLGQIWHFPAMEEVVGSITVVDTFLGVLLNNRSKNYRSDFAFPPIMGDLVAKEDIDGNVTGYAIQANADPFIVDMDAKYVAFEVKKK